MTAQMEHVQDNKHERDGEEIGPPMKTFYLSIRRLPSLYLYKPKNQECRLAVVTTT